MALPYESAYPSAWFDSRLADSRFLELADTGEEDDELSPQEMTIVLSVSIVKGVVDPTSGAEREGLDDLE
eukprot:7084056-Prymnesium_polylepis.1